MRDLHKFQANQPDFKGKQTPDSESPHRKTSEGTFSWKTLFPFVCGRPMGFQGE